MPIIDDATIDEVLDAIEAGRVDGEQIGALADAIEAWHALQPDHRKTEDAGEKRGTVTRWVAGETYGFVQSAGRTWFVSRRDDPLPPPGINERDQVVFVEVPASKPGGRYPHARIVRGVPQENGETS